MNVQIIDYDTAKERRGMFSVPAKINLRGHCGQASGIWRTDTIYRVIPVTVGHKYYILTNAQLAKAE